ncbi:hypothetical protein LTR53_018994, partial [Teratosphaeriaceae sp. CCFEE 6253]
RQQPHNSASRLRRQYLRRRLGCLAARLRVPHPPHWPLQVAAAVCGAVARPLHGPHDLLPPASHQYRVHRDVPDLHRVRGQHDHPVRASLRVVRRGARRCRGGARAAGPVWVHGRGSGQQHLRGDLDQHSAPSTRASAAGGSPTASSRHLWRSDPTAELS